MNKTCLAISPTPADFAPLLFAGELEAGFQKASSLGYDGVELSLRDSEQLDQDAIQSLLDANGLQAISFGTGQSYFQDGLSLADPDHKNQQAVRERLKGHIRFASKLGAMVVIGSIRGVLDQASSKSRTRGVQVAVDAVRELAEDAEQQGVLLLVEPINRYETNFLNTIQETMAFIEQVNSPVVRLLADTFHMNIEEPDLAAGFLQAREVLAHIHWVDSNRCAPGMGHIDFNQLLKILTGINYQGWLSAEILPEPDDDTAAETWIRSVRSLLGQ